MKEFEHGGRIFQAVADLGVDISEIDDFSANINPLVSEQKLRQWAAGCWQNVMHYPDVDYLRLRAAIAAYHAIDVRQVVVDNGATPLIHSIVEALGVKTGRITAPTFAEYEKALQRVGAAVDIVMTADDLAIPLQQLLIAAEKIDMIFICSPNNPTGKMCDLAAMVNFLEALPRSTYCLVDESFLPFTERAESVSLARLMARFDNLIVLRSVTKFFGIPGLRMGYALTANERLLNSLERRLPIWRVNSIAEQVVIEALKDVDFHVQSRAYIAEQRRYLTAQLKALGFIVYSASANYLLIRSHYKLDLYQYLYRRGIIIRRCQNYRGLNEHYYRIAVKSAAANKRLIAELKNVKEQAID